jgi:hypothetical protein
MIGKDAAHSASALRGRLSVERQGSERTVGDAPAAVDESFPFLRKIVDERTQGWHLSIKTITIVVFNASLRKRFQEQLSVADDMSGLGKRTTCPVVRALLGGFYDAGRRAIP